MIDAMGVETDRKAGESWSEMLEGWSKVSRSMGVYYVIRPASVTVGVASLVDDAIKMMQIKIRVDKCSNEYSRFEAKRIRKRQSTVKEMRCGKAK